MESSVYINSMIFLVLRYLRGEGCGAMVLKPAHKAMSGSVYANILAANVMSDGASVSITAPKYIPQFADLTHRTESFGKFSVEMIR